MGSPYSLYGDIQLTFGLMLNKNISPDFKKYEESTGIINPQRACAVRVMVLGLSVCVCVFVCVSVSRYSRTRDNEAVSE